jgi:DNA processing protein
MPFVLWVRGHTDLNAIAEQSVSIVGARASTAYGEHVATGLSASLADREFATISGGAYGIDAAAHRGALAASGGRAMTIAVMAGGVDKYYPPGNSDLLGKVADSGAVISESPPGTAPYRSRFLARNRIIAAMSGATVVVEAAMRSGALNTARHACDLLKPVGAVPGPITSMASAGCHQLLRDGIAICVTDAAEIVELATPIGVIHDDGAGTNGPGSAGSPLGLKERTGSVDTQPPTTKASLSVGETSTARYPQGQGQVVAARVDLTGLDSSARVVLDALPLRTAVPIESITKSAGRSLPEVLSALGVLETRGLAENRGNRWRRA